MDKKKIFFDAVVNNFIDVRTSISNVGYFFLPSCSVVIKTNHKIGTHKGEEFEHVRLTLNDLEKWTKPRFGGIFKNDYGITNEKDIFEIERMVVDMMAIGFIGYVIYWGLFRLEHRAIQWRRSVDYD